MDELNFIRAPINGPLRGVVDPVQTLLGIPDWFDGGDPRRINAYVTGWGEPESDEDEA